MKNGDHTMTPKVSVCITFCDKDFHLIKTLLSHIENNIKVSYEVLLYDNREKDNSDLDIHNYEIQSEKKAVIPSIIHCDVLHH